MRIALTGSHRTGKSTLVTALTTANPRLRATIEPYHHLRSQGYPFSPSLSLDDFVAQLEYSIRMLSGPTDKIVFDRCPLDFLGYIVCHHEASNFDFEEWVPRVQESMKTLDLLVRVPIETPDRTGPLAAEDTVARAAVDKAIQELLASSIFRETDTTLLTVQGSVQERVRQILRFLERGYG